MALPQLPTATQIRGGPGSGAGPMEAGGGRRVLVVGAGLAALGAAQRLQGPGSVRLLEAGSRAGGRIWSHPFGRERGRGGAPCSGAPG